MNKYDKILIVKKLGLNTEKSILIKSSNDPLLKKFIDKLDAVSIRTLHPDDDRIKSPHYPIVAKYEVIHTVIKTLAEGFWCIIATPIDPRYACYAGCMLKENNHIHIELVHGAYTVRRVTHDGFIDEKFDYPHDEAAMQFDTRIIDMLEQVKLVPFNHCIVELSYYSTHVGYKKEHVIIWNLDDDGTGIGMKQMEKFYHV
jgi:hypothetical protein